MFSFNLFLSPRDVARRTLYGYDISNKRADPVKQGNLLRNRVFLDSELCPEVTTGDRVLEELVIVIPACLGRTEVLCKCC